MVDCIEEAPTHPYLRCEQVSKHPAELFVRLELCSLLYVVCICGIQDTINCIQLQLHNTSTSDTYPIVLVSSIYIHSLVLTALLSLNTVVEATAFELREEEDCTSTLNYLRILLSGF